MSIEKWILLAIVGVVALIVGLKELGESLEWFGER
jgi:hypothetical protein